MKKVVRTISILEHFKDLYMFRRSKWIRQRKDGSYSTINFSLHDHQLEKHLEGSQTIGIFSGEVFTNLLTFDVDKGKKPTEELLEVLKTKYGLQKNEYLLSFSGSKGYHVTIFFEQPVPYLKVKLLYESVLADVGYQSNEIELRPTPTQGVKLPLSYNRKTGNRCNLVSEDFEPLDDEYILEVKKIAWKASWKLREANMVEDIVKNLNFNVPVDYESRCAQMLKRRKLLYSDSRHNSTLLLLVYLKEHGVEDPIRIVQEIIRNSEGYFKTPLEKALDEVIRLAKYAEGYKLPQPQITAVKIYDTDIRAILNATSKIPERRLLFSLLVHSKRWANSEGIFYISHKQLGIMGNDTSRTRSIANIQKLVDKGLLELVECRQKKKLPNKYRYKLEAVESERFIELETSTELEQTLTELIPIHEARALFSKKYFYSNIKDKYRL